MKRLVKIRFSTVVVTFLLIYLIFTLFLFFRIGENSIVSYQSMVYLSGLILMLITFLFFSTRVSYPLLILLIFYLFRKYCLPILLLLLHSKVTDWRTEYYSDFNSSDLNASMVYAIFGSVIMFIGFFVSAHGKYSSEKYISSLSNTIELYIHKIKPIHIFTLFLGILSINLYLFFVVGFGRLLMSSGDSGFNFLSVFTDTTPLLWLSIGALFFGWNKSFKKDKTTLVVTVCLMLIYSVLSGSRSFLFFLILILLFLKTVKDGNFYVKTKNMAYFLVVSILGIISFTLATALRYSAKEMLITKDNIVNYLDYFYLKGENYLFILVYDILYRLSDLSSSMLIMTNRWVVAPENYINIPHVIMDTINNLFPGDLFSDVIAGPRLFSFVYSGVTDPEYYNTEYFGIFEYFYILFGYAGGLIAVFAISLMIGHLWYKFLLIKIPFKHFWLIFFGFNFYLLMLNHGLSMWLSSAIRLVIVFSFNLMLLKFVIPPFLNIFNLGNGTKGDKLLTES